MQGLETLLISSHPFWVRSISSFTGDNDISTAYGLLLCATQLTDDWSSAHEHLVMSTALLRCACAPMQ